MTPTILESLLFHLVPGIFIAVIFALISLLTSQSALPAPLALLFTWVFGGIPLEPGTLLFLGYRRNRRFSTRGVVLFKEPLALRQYLWLIAILLIWAAISLTFLTPLASTFQNVLFSGWPNQWLLANLPIIAMATTLYF